MSNKLDLDTFAVHDTIGIDGKSYDLRNVGEMGLIEYRTIEAGYEKVKAVLADFDNASEEAVAEASAALAKAARILLPDAPHDRLSDRQRIDIIAKWVELNQAPDGDGADPTTLPSGETS